MKKIIKQIPLSKQLIYTWRQFDVDVLKLIDLLQKDHFIPKSLVCVAVGGLCLGAKMRNLTGKSLTIISTALYTGQQRRRTLTLNSSYTTPLCSPVLVLDDVADTGHTLQMVKEHLELGGIEVRTATLFYKESSIIKPDYYIHRTNRWVICPWEK